MRTVDMHEAKTHLSKPVQGAVDGEPFVIARAGKPLVKVTPVQPTDQAPKRRWGFAADRFASGEWRAPDDIKTPFREEIDSMFYGEEGFPLDEPAKDDLAD